jgi:P-type E1-E2 ATPase
VNNQVAMVVQDGQALKIRSRDLQVGDIIKVSDEGSIPCDMVLLSSAYADGQCYVTTANLDGETNLKVGKVLDSKKKFVITGCCLICLYIIRVDKVYIYMTLLVCLLLLLLSLLL